MGPINFIMENTRLLWVRFELKIWGPVGVLMG